jgi:hypothetical protein
VLNDSGQPAPSSGIRIAGNTTYGNSLGGIEVNSGTGAGGSHSNVTIIGNHSYGNTLANATQQGEGHCQLRGFWLDRSGWAMLTR